MKKPSVKNPIQIEKMRAAGQLAAQVLDMITPHVQPGVHTLKLDELCHDFIIKNNAIPAPLNYRGFPKSICTSINEVICHGIPSKKDVLKEGDIINIDVTVILDGWHGDTSRMYTVGNISPEAQRLIDTTYAAMMAGIETIKSGSKLSQVGEKIQQMADEAGYSVVRDFVGHGLGQHFHEMPQVLHYHPYPTGWDLKLRKGYTFTVEPMINEGVFEMEMMPDGWTAKTLDRKLSAQFEHSLAVTEEGVDILTFSPAGYTKPPYV